MDLDRLLDRAIRIQSISSPPFGERARSLALCDEFRTVGGPEPETDELGNCYVRCPGSGESRLVVSAHLDTVALPEDQLPAQRSGERIVGSGIGDNALALAALVELAIDLRELRPAGDVWLVADVGEEGLGNLRGMARVVDRFRDTVRAYIVLEGMPFGKVYHAGLPIRRLRLNTRTAGGHAWTHSGRPSAVHSLVQIAQALLAIPLREAPRSSLNIGQISGGSGVNVIAAGAWMDIDLRSEDPIALAALTRRVEEIAHDARCPGVSVELETIGERPGGGIPRDHPLVLAAIAAVEQSGGTAALDCGSTDASEPLSRGYPAVCVGLTHGGNTHGREEFIEIAPLAAGYAAVRRLIELALRL